jgi:hypothetical protein
MALEVSGDGSAGRRGSSTEQLDMSLVDDQVLALTEATSEQDAASNEENPSEDTGDNGNASDNDSRVKIGVVAALAGVSYDFRQPKLTRAHITSLKNSAHYFLKGFARSPDVESVLDHKENEAVVFEDFFIASLRITPHPIFWIFYENFRYNCIS